MTIWKHELKRNKISLIVWSSVIAFVLAVSILIYPQMAEQMDEISKMFADMGSFSAAFGMDRLNFGEFMGYFAVECGNSFGIGGALFAALLGISALAKEEKDHTAEFLLTHPVSRTRVVTEKLFAVVTQLVILDAAVILASAFSMVLIGASADVWKMTLLFLAYFLMQFEIAMITFGISAFISRAGLGIGLGLAVLAYFVNILSNLMDEMKFLKYFTPFGYTDGANIVNKGTIHMGYLSLGMLFAAAGMVAAYLRYRRKDIA